MVHADATPDDTPNGQLGTEWLPMKDAKTGRWLLVFDGYIGRPVVAQSMTATEDGAVNWVYARRLGLDEGKGLAFICTEPLGWMELPLPPKEFE